jgi:hypothetical protein
MCFHFCSERVLKRPLPSGSKRIGWPGKLYMGGKYLDSRYLEDLWRRRRRGRKGTKIYMARDETFTVSLPWHARCAAVNMLSIDFHGLGSYAGETPWQGQSAHHAAELFTHNIANIWSPQWYKSSDEDSLLQQQERQKQECCSKLALRRRSEMFWASTVLFKIVESH